MHETSSFSSNHCHSFTQREEEKPISRDVARRVSAAMVAAFKDGHKLSFEEAIAPFDEAERAAAENRALHMSASLAAYERAHGKGYVSSVGVLSKLNAALPERLRIK